MLWMTCIVMNERRAAFLSCDRGYGDDSDRSINPQYSPYNYNNYLFKIL